MSATTTRWPHSTQLGQQLGVRGTPAMMTEDGTLIPGYQSADDLMVTLGLNKD